MKRFALFSFGCLCLMLAVAVGYHLGSQAAQAQAPEPIGGVMGSYQTPQMRYAIMLSNGDVYENNWHGAFGYFVGPPTYRGNFWYDQPVPSESSTWGGIKSQLETKGD